MLYTATALVILERSASIGELVEKSTVGELVEKSNVIHEACVEATKYAIPSIILFTISCDQNNILINYCECQ